jgi:hypothetical protein
VSRRHRFAILVAFAAIAYGLSGCHQPDSTNPAQCDAERMARWVLDCVEKGNPHSDEEPEDATRQCEATAAHLFCGPTCYISAKHHQLVCVEEDS